MARLQVHKLVPMLLAIAFTSATLLVTAKPADAGSAALFRATRMWWFSHTDSWTDSSHPFHPSTGGKSGMNYEPPATATLTTLTAKPGFAIPYAFIKNTTYYFACPSKGFQCYDGYPESKGWYSYWQGRAHFQKSNPQAASAATTIRVRTFGDGWPGPVDKTGGGMNIPPKVDGTPVSPTTTYDGRYAYDRGGSIMIVPGTRKFGGTMRWFGGPNGRGYQLINLFDPIWFKAYSVSPPLDEQAASDVPMELGEVSTAGVVSRFRLTNPGHNLREIRGSTDPGSVDCSDPARIYPPSSQQKDPQNNSPTNVGCYYYVNFANYLITRAAYTTGQITNWDVFGTSSFQTETGYDNRFIDSETGGLKGVVSMVHPRLFTTYTVESPAAVGGGRSPGRGARLA